MIEFRQKEFGIVPEKWIESAKKNVKESPVSTGISVAGLGLSGTNFAINKTRKKNEEKFQKDQIEATNKLVEAINESEEKRKANEEKPSKISRLKRKTRLLKKSQKPYTRSYDLTPGLEEAKNSVLDKLDKNDRI